MFFAEMRASVHHRKSRSAIPSCAAKILLSRPVRARPFRKSKELRSVRYFTNETIFDELETKPESMIVLGGGPIGCELGQTFARLGVRVTIVQRGSQLLPREDRDVADFLETASS